jgi:hypothetical protein
VERVIPEVLSAFRRYSNELRLFLCYFPSRTDLRGSIVAISPPRRPCSM